MYIGSENSSVLNNKTGYTTTEKRY